MSGTEVSKTTPAAGSADTKSEYKTDPVPNDWKTMTDKAKVTWLRGQADPDAPKISLGDIMDGNFQLYEQLQPVSDLLTFTGNQILKLDALKTGSQRTAVEAIFNTLDAALKAYAQKLYETADDLRENGEFKGTSQVREYPKQGPKDASGKPILTNKDERKVSIVAL